MKSRLKRDLVENMIRLRRRGHSLPEIARLSQVSKTTVFRHIRDVEILPEFLNVWSGKWGGSKKRMATEWDKANQMAELSVASIELTDELIAGCCLYWAEGSKKDFNFMNSDPEMIRLFVKLLMGAFKVNKDRIKLNLRIYPGIEESRAKIYWSEVSGLPVDNFGRSEVVKGPKKGRLEFGMCRVRVVKGGSLLKYMVALRKRLLVLIGPHSSTDRARVS